MLTRNEIKFINSLSKKKYRDESGMFIAEGWKLVNDLKASGLALELLVEGDEVRKVSQLKTPSDVLAVFHKKTINTTLLDDTILLLDTIQDPGNLGTIVRTADWFGLRQVICSEDCVDVYSPKVVQATMGAIGRVDVWEADLVEVIKKNPDRAVYGTFLEGENIYESSLDCKGFVVMGNEGQGISSEVEKLVTKRLFIPPYPVNAIGMESLNVSVACGIVCSEMRRKLSASPHHTVDCQ